MSTCSMAMGAARGVRLIRPVGRTTPVSISKTWSPRTGSLLRDQAWSRQATSEGIPGIKADGARGYASWTSVGPISTAICLSRAKKAVKTSRLTVARQASTTAVPAPSASTAAPKTPRSPRRKSRLRFLYYLAAFLAITGITYETVPPARRLLIASIRCLRLLKAVALSVLDYKYTFLDWYPADKYSAEERKQLQRTDRHACHARSSERLFQALKKSAGIYVKLGQHIASIQALPVE